MHNPRLTGHSRLAAIAVTLLLVTTNACAGSGAPTGATPLPTPVNIANISLNPVAETTPPEPAESADAVPSAARPSGIPPSAEVSVDYAREADDSAGFADAYRTALKGVALDDEAVATAGARLCTYLMRHADGGGSVALREALAEADLNEPGYARDAWLTAFKVATTYYCGEFAVDFER